MSNTLEFERGACEAGIFEMRLECCLIHFLCANVFACLIVAFAKGIWEGLFDRFDDVFVDVFDVADNIFAFKLKLDG